MKKAELGCVFRCVPLTFSVSEFVIYFFTFHYTCMLVPLPLPPPVIRMAAGKPSLGRDSLGSMLSESSTSDEEKRRSGSNDRVSPERHDLTTVRGTGGGGGGGGGRGGQ